MRKTTYQPLMGQQAAGAGGEYRLYSFARGVWDPVLNGGTDRPAVFDSRCRASWTAAALCEELGVAIEVREGAEVLEEWMCDSGSGRAFQPCVAGALRSKPERRRAGL